MLTLRQMIGAIVGVFARGIVVVDVEAEAQAAAGAGVLQHLQVTIGVAEGRDGAAADVLVDPDGFNTGRGRAADRLF
jgi:hypothetical protein